VEKQFLKNASLVFKNSVSIKKYKEELEKNENQIDALSNATSAPNPTTNRNKTNTVKEIC